MNIVHLVPESDQVILGGMDVITHQLNELCIYNRNISIVSIPIHNPVTENIQLSEAEYKLILDADVVHAHDFIAAHVAINLEKIKKLILSVHLLHCRYSYYPDIFECNDEIRSLECQAIIAADSVLAVSEYMKVEIIKTYGRKDVIALTNCISLPSLKPENNESSCPIFTFFGRITEQKGAKDIPSAFSKIISAIPDAKFYIIGDGDLRKEVDNSLPHNISSNTTFLGNLEQTKAHEFIKSSDVVISLSKFEPFGLSYLESIALGKPILGKITGGMNEYCTPKINSFPLDLISTISDGDSEVIRSSVKLSRSDHKNIVSSVNNFIKHHPASQFELAYNQVA